MHFPTKLLTALAGSILLLSGCSFSPSHDQIMQFIDRYDETKSFATNVTVKVLPTFPKQFDYGNLQKWVYGTYIPDEEYTKIFGSTDAKSGIVFEGNAPKGPDYTSSLLLAGSQLAKSSAFSLLGSNKVDALLFFLWSAPASQSKYSGVNFCGFVKKTDAATAEQAKSLFLSNLTEAYKKMLEEYGFGSFAIQDEVKGTAVIPIFGQGDIIEHRYLTATKTDDETKTVRLHFQCSQYAPSAIDKNVAPWISPANEPAWLIQANYSMGGGYFENKKFVPVKTYEMFAAAAKYFPDYSYVLLPQHPFAVDEKGEEKWAAPFMADNKARYWYVMPESAKRK